MNLSTELKESIEGVGKSFESYKETNDARLRALEKGDETLARELDEKLDRINVDLTKNVNLKEGIERELKFANERIEELEARASEPGYTKLQQAEKTHADLFDTAIRSQFAPQFHTDLKKAEHDMLQTKYGAKAVTIGTGAAGGFAVPEEIARSIEKLERKLSPVRDLVDVIPVGTSDFKKLVSIGGAASGWVGEGGTRSETGTPQLREVTPTMGELYAYPQASEWSLDDAFFSIENWLRDETAEEFAYQEGLAVISGDGTSKPTGMTNTAPVATADWASPLRAAAAYQFVASAASPDALVADSLFDCVYALNRKYRAGATWAFNSTTAGVIRKLKDTTNQYLWQPGLSAGEPSQLLGYPTSSWEDMADVGANALPVAFGNFKRAYMLVDRVGLRITVDNVTNPGHVRFYIRRREGGIPLNNDALKFIKTT
jgi:HK97 family phage major capsid protein